MNAKEARELTKKCHNGKLPERQTDEQFYKEYLNYISKEIERSAYLGSTSLKHIVSGSDNLRMGQQFYMDLQDHFEGLGFEVNFNQLYTHEPKIYIFWDEEIKERARKGMSVEDLNKTNKLK